MSPLSSSARPRSGVRAALRPRFVVPVVVIAGGAVGATFALSGASTTSDSTAKQSAAAPVDGWPAEGAVLQATKLAAMTVHVGGGVTATQVQAALDGAPVPVRTEGGQVVLGFGTVTDGKHTLSLTVGSHHYTRSFTIDSTPPALAVTAPKPLAKGQPLTLTGTTDPGATVTANGQPASVTGGAWTASFATAPSQVTVVATDKAGNSATEAATVKFVMPSTRAVHMTALAWAYAPKRNAVLALIKAHKINAVEVDIKDEDGNIGYKSQVPLALKDGATKEAAYDAKKMIAQLHGMNVRVIGRLVAFHDPKLAMWAWKHGDKDWVIQDKHHQPWQGKYGSFAFSNFANSHVQQYNVDLAVEAAKLGFDDVLYDYVRRPDGKLSEMTIPGLKADGQAQVAEFMGATRRAFDKAGVSAYLGACVFGEAATRPKEIAQNIPMIAKYADYVAPMVYPSHWNPGEYGVKDPNSMPYPIVNRALKDFLKDVKGTNATVVPWLQDFSLGVHYTAAMVLAQEKAAHDDGIDNFLLWNAGCNYTAAALPVLK